MVTTMDLAKGEHSFSVGDVWSRKATMEICVEVPQKLKIDIPYAIWSLWGIYLETISQYRGTCSSIFSVILLTIALDSIIL